MTLRAPRMTWPRPAREVREGSLWFVASTGALRAPWRLSVYVAAFVVVWTLANSFVYPVLSLATSWLESPPALYSLLMLFAVTGATAIALRQVDGQSWSHIACGRNAWRGGSLTWGAVLGFLAITTVTVVLLLSGGAQFSTVRDGSGLSEWSAVALRSLWVLAPAALWEELVFRGYLWRVAEQAGGARVALWTTSVAFAAVHGTNPGANARTLAVVLLAGLCLGVVRELTHSVPAAWLAHLAWNFTMAAVVHAPVSGLPVDAPGWRFEPAEPSWWSGGAWGPEGGAASVLVLLGALSWYAYHTKRPVTIPESNMAVRAVGLANPENETVCQIGLR